MLRLESDLLALDARHRQRRARRRAAARFSPATPRWSWSSRPRAIRDRRPEGGAISGLDVAGAKVFQAGTALEEGRLVAEGGRVLGVAARGASVAEARRAAYRAVDAIDFPDGFCRRDIGWREIARGA